MNVTLNFSLPEDQVDLDLALAAPRLQRALTAIGEELRRHRKYVPHEDDTLEFIECLERFVAEATDAL